MDSQTETHLERDPSHVMSVAERNLSTVQPEARSPSRLARTPRTLPLSWRIELDRQFAAFASELSPPTALTRFQADDPPAGESFPQSLSRVR